MDIETALLGCFLVQPDSFILAKEIINKNDFSIKNNMLIFEAIEHLSTLDIVADIFTISDYFQKKQIDITFKDIDFLLDNAGIAANVNHYCSLIKENSTKRKLKQEIKTSLENIDLHNSKDFASELMANLIKLDTDYINKFTTASAFEQYLKDYQCNTKLLSSGFSALDTAFNGGLNKHSFNVIAAQSGTGKTVFSINQVVNKLHKQEKILYINLEIPITDMLEIIIPQVYNKLDYSKLVQKQYPLENLQEIFKKKFTNNLYFAKNCYAIEEIIAQIDLHRINYKIDCVFIDHLQLIKNASNYEIYTEITKTLKRYCLKHQISIFALSQLNDKQEDKADKEPVKSSLRGGANLFQDADTVIFIYKLGIDSKETYLKIAKNRKGTDGQNKYYQLQFFREKRKVHLIELEQRPTQKTVNTKVNN